MVQRVRAATRGARVCAGRLDLGPTTSRGSNASSSGTASSDSTIVETASNELLARREPNPNQDRKISNILFAYAEAYSGIFIALPRLQDGISPLLAHPT